MEKRRKLLLTLNFGEIDKKIIGYINEARTNPREFGRMILNDDNENDYCLRDLALFFNKNPFEEEPIKEDENLVITAKRMMYKFILIDNGAEIINLPEKDKNKLKLQKRLEELNKYSKYYKEFIIMGPESAFDAVINLLLVEKYKKILLSSTIKYIGVASCMLPSERICVIIDIVDDFYDKKKINNEKLYDNSLYSSTPFKYKKLNILSPKKIFNGIKYLNRSISPSVALKISKNLSPERKFSSNLSNYIFNSNSNSKIKNEEQQKKLRYCLSPVKSPSITRVDSVIHFRNDNSNYCNLKYVMNTSFQVLSNSEDINNVKTEKNDFINDKDKNFNDFTFSEKKNNPKTKNLNKSSTSNNLKKYIKKTIGNNTAFNNNVINRTKGKIIPIYSKQKTLKDGSHLINFFPLDKKLKDY